MNGLTHHLKVQVVCPFILLIEKDVKQLQFSVPSPSAVNPKTVVNPPVGVF